MHTPPDMSLWTGRDDTELEGPDATRIHQCIKPWTEDSPPGVCLLGFACDEGVRRNHGRVGAAQGPTALRKSLANLAWSNEQRLYDAGDVQCIDRDLESAQHIHASIVAKLLHHNQRVISLGGGHETAWGSFLGLTQAFPQKSVGIVNVDAHFDLRPGPRANSGTPFRQMAEWSRAQDTPFRCVCVGVAEQSNTPAAFRVAETLGVEWESDTYASVWRILQEMHGPGKRVLDETDAVLLSIDLDVLSGSLMPAVSAPAAVGVSVDAVEGVIDLVTATGKLKVADVVEFSPAFDRDGQAARTAARLIWRLAEQWSKVQ